MKEIKRQFLEDFPKFQVKIHNFVRDTNFAAKTEEYTELFNQMASVSPDDMKEYIQKSPAFLNARNKSLALMEQIVALHKRLEELFSMDAETLGEKYDHDLTKVDRQIAQELKEAARLLQQFDRVSEEGRKAIEQVDSPFFSQAL
jgi:ElaB/YqjD/DUF883 family membrane-anchored ribosome-binding protein